jgi:hypothetical protein
MEDLKNGMLFTGQLSEVHVENMKRLPFIFFNGIKSINLAYDIGLKREDKSIMTYKLDLDKESNNELPKRYAALESALRSLFWKELILEIYIGDELEFKSEDLCPAK